MQLILLISAIFMIKWNIVLAIFAFIILIIQSYIITKFRNPILYNIKKTKIKAQEINSYTVEHFKKIQLIKSLSTENLEQKIFLNKLKELINKEISGH
jgi:ABC-type bacteriocin/lantibiotic exporter with double-glycine peptidase domain